MAVASCLVGAVGLLGACASGWTRAPAVKPSILFPVQAGPAPGTPYDLPGRIVYWSGVDAYDPEVGLVDLRTGQQSTLFVAPNGAALRDVVASPEGKALAISWSKWERSEVGDVKSWAIVSLPVNDPGAVRMVAAGQLVYDGHASTGQEVGQVAWSANGRQLLAVVMDLQAAYGDPDHGRVLWNLYTYDLSPAGEETPSASQRLFQRDATARGDTQENWHLAGWDSTARRLAIVRDVTVWTEERFSDGRHQRSGSGYDELQLVDVESGAVTKPFPAGMIRQPAFGRTMSPDGRWVAVDAALRQGLEVIMGTMMVEPATGRSQELDLSRLLWSANSRTLLGYTEYGLAMGHLESSGRWELVDLTGADWTRRGRPLALSPDGALILATPGDRGYWFKRSSDALKLYPADLSAPMPLPWGVAAAGENNLNVLWLP